MIAAILCPRHRITSGGMVSKFAAFLDENSPSIPPKSHVAYTRVMAAIRRSMKKPDEPMLRFLQQAEGSASALEQCDKFLAFVQSRLFSHFPIQYVKAANIAHQIYTAGSDGKEHSEVHCQYVHGFAHPNVA